MKCQYRAMRVISHVFVCNQSCICVLLMVSILPLLLRFFLFDFDTVVTVWRVRCIFYKLFFSKITNCNNEIPDKEIKKNRFKRTKDSVGRYEKLIFMIGFYFYTYFGTNFAHG